ncbi:uncharacterized protein LOC34619408 [Cyclospora cayetanensis]|nr:uncharacterized protein LOC34619408 [Cyclospora cayetanensis]
MKLAVVAISLALLRLSPVECTGQQSRTDWTTRLLEGQPGATYTDSKHLPGAASWWNGLALHQDLPNSQVQPQHHVFTMPSMQPQMGVRQQELVQQRLEAKTKPAGSVGVDQRAVPGAATSTAAASLWRASSTGQAVQELATRTFRVFQRPSTGWGGNSEFPEVLVPAENVLNALVELSKLVQAVRAFCEAESTQRRLEGDFAEMSQRMPNSAGAASMFPVDAFIKQGHSYARRVTGHLRALRDLLNTVCASDSTRESVLRAVHVFNSTMSDTTKVYRLGTQLAGAAVGAVLPHVSTCSFFSKNGPRDAYKLLTLVNSRILSTLRYLYKASELSRKVAGELVDLVSGNIPPQSVQDFAGSQPFLRAASYLTTAEARSVSAVTYFNELAAAYKSHTAPSSLSSVGQTTGISPADSPLGEDQQTIEYDQDVLSLMADDLDIDGSAHAEGNPEYADYDSRGTQELQTVADDMFFHPSDGTEMDLQSDVSQTQSDS